MSENKPTRKESNPLHRNIWQIVVRVPDTRRVIHIARQADRGIRSLRNGLLVRFPAEDVLPLLQEYDEATRALNNVTEKICERAGMPYKAPKGLTAA